MYTLIIPLAGYGTRMESKIPKALTLVEGRSLLDISSSGLKKFAVATILVLSKVNSIALLKEAKKCKFKKISKVYQVSPNGTAYAVLEALQITQTNYAVTVWGDHIGAEAFPSELLINEFQKKNFDIVIPLIEVSNPYVYFNLKGDTIRGFHETRKGAPQIKKGFSDVGVFGLNVENVRTELRKWIEINSEVQDLNLLSFFASPQSRVLRVKIFKLDKKLNHLTFGINSKADLRKYLDQKLGAS
jgi:bifunctional N-acetylglucosamine-1-phosphate-uridyltransferase/glucosamine-1-phosphate-acetyltransferase GlmU-like protein